MQSTVAQLTRSKAVLAVVIGAVVLAVAATGIGYAAMSKQVTLSIDGKSQQVRTFGSTVGNVLKDKGLSLSGHDAVAPGVDSAVADGQTIAVRYGRPLDVKVDGRSNRYWVTATDVSSALDQLGLRFGGANLTASRGATISRSGMSLGVVTPKTVTVKLAGAKKRSTTVTALRVGGALKELGVKVDGNDKVKPGLGRTLRDGDRLTFTKVRVLRRRATEALGFGTVKQADSGMYSDQTRTVRTGRDGSRNVVYRVTLENGHLTKRKAMRVNLLRSPVTQIVRYGTKQRPAPAPAPTSNYAGGSGAGTGSPHASPAATGPPTPATATTAACSSPSARGSPTAAPAVRTRTAARRRSPSPSGSAPPRVATAPGPCVVRAPDHRRVGR